MTITVLGITRVTVLPERVLERAALGDRVEAMDRDRIGSGLRPADGAPKVALVLELSPIDSVDSRSEAIPE